MRHWHAHVRSTHNRGELHHSPAEHNTLDACAHFSVQRSVQRCRRRLRLRARSLGVCKAFARLLFSERLAAKCARCTIDRKTKRQTAMATMHFMFAMGTSEKQSNRVAVILLSSKTSHQKSVRRTNAKCVCWAHEYPRRGTVCRETPMDQAHCDVHLHCERDPQNNGHRVGVCWALITWTMHILHSNVCVCMCNMM